MSKSEKFFLYIYVIRAEKNNQVKTKKNIARKPATESYLILIIPAINSV